MANNTEIHRNLGKIGEYNVETLFVSKRLFPTAKRWTGGGYEEYRMSIMQRRKTVTLRSDKWPMVQFEAYIHRGQTNYKDSREKKSVSEIDAISEICRMLDCSESYAKRLLSVSASDAIAA